MDDRQPSNLLNPRDGGALQVLGTPYLPVMFRSFRDNSVGGDDAGPGVGPARGDWGGLVFNHVSRGSIDHALISYAGGRTPIEGAFANFAPVEIHQAQVRLTNSTGENNGSGADSSNRNDRLGNQGSTIFVRGAQPILVNNVIRNNAGAAIHIDVNSLTSFARPDYGRSTGPIDLFSQLADNRGPLIRLNQLADNGVNGLEIRHDVLTTEGVWDDTDIVHGVRGEIMVGADNHDTDSGLWLQSSATESLVVKLAGANAGFTASGEPLDINDRMVVRCILSADSGIPS